jgi:hypothetical protein
MTDVPLVQLLDDHGSPYDLVVSGDPRTYADLTTPAGLAELVAHVQGIGPNKRLIVPSDASNRRGSPTALVGDAHRAGLLVHPWTFRRENLFLPEDLRRGDPASPAYLRAAGDVPAELRQFCQLGVDGCSATTRTSRSPSPTSCPHPEDHERPIQGRSKTPMLGMADRPGRPACRWDGRRIYPTHGKLLRSPRIASLGTRRGHPVDYEP